MGENKENTKRNPFVKIIYEVFPHIPRNKANKNIRREIDSIGEMLTYNDELSVLKTLKAPEKIDVKILRDMIDDNKHRMERLEDKSKVQIVGITLAISIMTGIAGSMKDLVLDTSWLKWVVFVVLLASVIYLFAAGIEAIHMLTNENVFYYLPYNISEQQDNELRQTYNAVVAKNQLQNTIRNNEISTSYALMRNAIVLLLVVFVIWIIPVK